jgi:hypothetical protein
MAQSPSSAQIRAARAMLDWSIVELARTAKVSAVAVQEAEGRGVRAGRDDQRALILDTLREAGITFLDDGAGAGLHLAAR